MRNHLQSRRRIADLAQRLHAMEAGTTPMQPQDYRVLSKRLRQALATLPEPAARSGFSELPAPMLPLMAEMLETRHFEHHGQLFGIQAPWCRAVAEALVDRLMCRRHR